MNRLIFIILRLSGLPLLFREWIQRHKVTILLFHDIEPDKAARTFHFLARKYNIIGLNLFLEAIRTQNPGLLPQKALILTFDDGHKGNYELLPLVKNQQIPITIFLCSGIINTTRHFWFAHAYDKPKPDNIKRFSNQERLKILEEMGFQQGMEYDQRQALTKNEINEMSKWIDFQAHTVFHPCLPSCEEQEEIDEITLSKKALEQDYGFHINAFAYPNGDYSDRSIEICKQAGFDCAITVDYGFNTIYTDPYRLKRISVNDTGDMDELSVKASGVWAFFKSKNGKINGHLPIYANRSVAQPSLVPENQGVRNRSFLRWLFPKHTIFRIYGWAFGVQAILVDCL